jgi:hypothetical protein
MSEPVAVRYDFDGHGYLYMDAGSGSDWASRVKDCEFLYTHPMCEVTDEQIHHVALQCWDYPIEEYPVFNQYKFARAIIKASRGEK